MALRSNSFATSEIGRRSLMVSAMTASLVASSHAAASSRSSPPADPARRIPLGPDNKPQWLTFDCYGTLIQWDEGLVDVATKVIRDKGANADPKAIVQHYDQHEGDLERHAPFKTFHEVSSQAFKAALAELGVDVADGQALVDAIPGFRPFPEARSVLGKLKAAGFKVSLISNTDDDLVAGNVAQLGGLVDHVVTAKQARAYKPSRHIFEHALSSLGIAYNRMVHICAGPDLDHAAARDQQFRCVWIDRGTYRKRLADYTPNETFPTLEGVPGLFAKLGWM